MSVAYPSIHVDKGNFIFDLSFEVIPVTEPYYAIHDSGKGYYIQDFYFSVSTSESNLKVPQMYYDNLSYTVSISNTSFTISGTHEWNPYSEGSTISIIRSADIIYLDHLSLSGSNSTVTISLHGGYTGYGDTLFYNDTYNTTFQFPLAEFILKINPNGGYRDSDKSTEVIEVTKAYGTTENISVRKRAGYDLIGYKMINTDNGYTEDLGGAHFDFDSSNKTGVFTQGSVPVTLIAQWKPLGLMSIKTSTGWQKGLTWINENGTWRKGIPWVHKDGSWDMGGK